MTEQELINNISKSNYLTYMNLLREKLHHFAYILMEDQHNYINHLQRMKQILVEQYKETGTWDKLTVFKGNIYYFNKQHKPLYLTPFSKLPKYVTYKKAFGYAVYLHYKYLQDALKYKTLELLDDTRINQQLM
jgi:hypothetical protein